MTDIVTPNGQTVLNGHDDHDHSHAGLWALSGDHRLSAQLGTEGRIDGLATTFNLKAIADLEARVADRFTLVLDAVKSEAGRTRECLMQQRLDDLRHENTKLSVTVRA